MSQYTSKLQLIKEQALNNGVLIENERWRELNNLPHTFPQHNLNIIVKDLTQHIPQSFIDPEISISLATYSDVCRTKEPNLLCYYANKLPIMCVNASRLKYVIDCFKYIQGTQIDALNFIIQTSIQQVHDSEDPSNLKFSRLLHNLKSTGDEFFFCKLAERIGLDIDIVKTNNLIYRYTLKEIKTIRQPVLTCFLYNGFWYGVVSKDHQL